MRQIMGISMARDLNLLKKVAAFVIVENERGEILLQKRSDTELWGLPGGVKEAGKAYEEVTFKELSKEPGLHLAQLSLYRMFSNNMAIYMAKSYFGFLKGMGLGTPELRFFSLYDLPVDFQETSKLIVDVYAADHFWIGG
jgi:8-oxo-dGTP pyrophosphatase MutT (NUDIX family)